MITPNSEKCRIYVDGTPYYWQDGQSVLFDETYIHSAKNETDTDRIILFCDVERPLRNGLVRLLNTYFAKYILAAASTRNLPTDRVGFLNKMYRYYHHIAILSNHFKKKNKIAYRFLQYTILIGVALLIFM